MTSIADRVNGRRVVASVSGGKDSAAMCLWLRSTEAIFTKWDELFRRLAK